MGLITKEVEMKWNINNKKYYESKGYIFTKYKDEFKIKIEHLTYGSNIMVDVKCDGCGKEKQIIWADYNKCKKENDQYYCKSCARKLYNIGFIKKNRIKQSGKSFEQWCINNNHQDILDRWDYDLNECNPNEINYSAHKKYYFKCPRGMHKSELKDIANFVQKQKGSMDCIACNSFEQWCIENNRQDVLDRWDYELNNKKPNEITYGTGKQFYFKCPNKVHKSELKNIHNFISGKDGTMNCKACNSFAQWGIDNVGEDFLDKYWDYEKNTVDPWEVSYGSFTNKVWIKCQEKDYHGSYGIKPSHFIVGNRCSYCNNKKVHPLDSLGKLLEDRGLLYLWSDKNKKSPYEYAPKSSKEKVYWKCPNGLHEDYPRNVASSSNLNFRCPECEYSKGEEKISSYLISIGFIKVSEEDYKILDDVSKTMYKYYIPQKKFEGLVGLKNGLLSYDFYLPQYNLLVEFQGEQHKRYCRGFHKSKKDFKKQVEHDQRKREFAKSNNINLLEIWYYDFDNIETILDLYLINFYNKQVI